MDAVPRDMRAGETYQIGYLIRQHGVTPVRDATPAVRITQGSTGVVFPGRAEGAPGHYVSEITFPTDGEWSWVADQSPFPMEQSLGTITIAAAAPATVEVAVPVAPAAAPLPAIEIAGAGLALVTLGAISLVIVQGRRAPARA